MLPCKACFECQLEFLEDSSKRVGCASCLSLTCKSCGWTQTFFTSEKMSYIFEINQRMVYSMRSIGCGLSAMNRFCYTMNMPPPVGTKPFSSHNKTILRAVKDVAEKTTKDAAQEIFTSKTQNGEEIAKTAVSCDGTWQRRGFSSLNGCVTVISKTVYVGSDAFQLGVYDAVAHFNIENKATIQVLEALGMKPGSFCLAGVIEADRRRVVKANYKSEDRNKKQRKVLRGKRKQEGDKNEQKEGKTYDPGAF